MKKAFLALFIVLFVISLYFLMLNSQYTVIDDTYHLQKSISSFMDRPLLTADSIDIRQSIDIDNKKYVLFTRDGSMGFAVLSKGFNNRYKIYSVESGGSGLFRGYVYKTDRAKYLIIYGRNYKSRIDYIKVSLENREYKINVPKQEYYIVYNKVPYNNKNKFPDMRSYKFFDINDVEINS